MSEKKSLPKVDLPSLTETFPISKTKVLYRPFIIREQKALMLAQNSDDQGSIFETISNVVHSCTNGTADVKKLSYADLTWLFLKISNASTGPERTVSVTCTDENCATEFLMNINLDDVKIKNADIDPKVMITPTIGIKMRVPTYEDVVFIEDHIDDAVAIIYHLIDMVFDEDQVYLKSDYTQEEFSAWMEGFSDEQLIPFDEYINTLPDLSHEYVFDCPKCGKKHRKLVEGLLGFFRVKSGKL